MRRVGGGLGYHPDVPVKIVSFNKQSLLDEDLEKKFENGEIEEKVTTLELNANALEFNVNFANKLSELTVLELRENKVRNIEIICKLTKLRSLYLTSNELEYIPAVIENLTALERLIVPNNRVSKVPKEVCMLPRLRWLYLHGNRITTLPWKSMREMKSLQSLTLQDNFLPHQFMKLVVGSGQTSALLQELSDYPCERCRASSLCLVWLRFNFRETLGRFGLIPKEIVLEIAKVIFLFWSCSFLI